MEPTAQLVEVRVCVDGGVGPRPQTCNLPAAWDFSGAALCDEHVNFYVAAGHTVERLHDRDVFIFHDRAVFSILIPFDSILPPLERPQSRYLRVVSIDDEYVRWIWIGKPSRRKTRRWVLLGWLLSVQARQLQ